VGEIRDEETAEIAVQAALTGHLVLSTLHTNDSFGAITRLIDMGIDVYKVASSLEAVLAQRLLRKLCPYCKVEIQPDDVEKKLIPFISNLRLEPRFYHAKGCPKCGFTGYKGRIGVYEILLLDEELKDLIASGASIYQIHKAARKKGFKNLYEDALRHIAEGITDYKEVLRIINPDSFGQEGVLKLNESDTSHETIITSEEEDRPPVILLVEDNHGMRKMVRILIEKKTNWKLLEAEDGLKAMEIVNKKHVDLIILDVMMPNMDGYEFLSYLRKNLSTATIPVLMLTSLNGPDNEVKALEIGADDYISKPYNPNVLLARIKRLLRRSKNRPFKNSGEGSNSSKLNMKLV